MALIDKLVAIADAIRGKTGGSGKLTLDEMAAAVRGIETGGNIDALIDGSMTEIVSNATQIPYAIFKNHTGLTSINFPLAQYIGEYTFSNCSSLKTVNCPLVATLYRSAFASCTALTEIYLPAATVINERVFQNCTALTTVDLPVLSTINEYVFGNNKSLTRLILRSEIMVTLADVTAFNGCYHILGTVDATYNPDGLKDGYIYVPKALIEDYKVATNWSNFADQFRALEDYTVDGTITGALDESKI